MADLLDRVHPRPGGGLCRDGQWPLGCALPSFSQLAEDQFAISEIFPGKQGGTFIEVGGYNGLWMSNSRTLEWMFGWSGLLVEAHPRLFDELSANRGKQSVTVHSAVCNGTQSVTFRESKFGLGSSHIAGTDVRGDHRASYTVQCGTLGRLARAAGLSAVDFLSVDVESHEVPVLLSFDWSIKVGAAVVETSLLSDKSRALIRHLFAEHAGLHEAPPSNCTAKTNTWYVQPRLLRRIQECQRAQMPLVFAPVSYRLTDVSTKRDPSIYKRWSHSTMEQARASCKCAPSAPAPSRR